MAGSADRVAQRIHITGASGAGTTTLGQHLALKLECGHLDTDDFYWLPTDPPFQTKREASERLQMLTAALGEDFVLSGSLDGWRDPLIPRFTAVVFLDTPTEIRLTRLQQREVQRFGQRALEPGGRLYDHHREFLDWAASYDRGDMDGRSRKRHEAWLARLACPVIVAHGDQPVERLLTEVLAGLTRAADIRK